MGMSGQDDLGTSSYCLRRPVCLEELEEPPDLLRSQLNGMQCELMGYVAPPSLMGNRVHRAGTSLCTTHHPAPSIPQDRTWLSFSLSAHAGTHVRQPVTKLRGAGDPAPLTCFRSGQSRSRRRDQHLLLVVVVGRRVGGRGSEGARGGRRLRPVADGLDCVEGWVGGHVQDICGAAADGQAKVVANEGDADRDERAEK